MPRTLPPTRIGDWQSVPTLCEPRFSQSVERGLAILGCFSPGRPLLGIADLADALGMSRSTTHRYVITLTRLGYLAQGPKRKYHLAVRVVDLGMSALNSTSLDVQARPYIEELCRRTGFTVTVAVLDGPEVVLVDCVRGNRRGRQPIDVAQAPGSRLPVHCTAVGKLLLAHLPAAEQRHVLSEMKLTRHTSHTITSKAGLRKELQNIGEQSLATEDEELEAGRYSIAAPIHTESREVVAAIGMDVPKSLISLEVLVDELGAHVISTADRVSARLGYRRDDELARSFAAGSGTEQDGP